MRPAAAAAAPTVAASFSDVIAGTAVVVRLILLFLQLLLLLLILLLLAPLLLLALLFPQCQQQCRTATASFQTKIMRPAAAAPTIAASDTAVLTATDVLAHTAVTPVNVDGASINADSTNPNIDIDAADGDFANDVTSNVAVYPGIDTIPTM